MPPSYKVVLLGDSSVGKTSLVHRFTADSFDPHSANTIGAAFILKPHTFEERTLKFEIWDTAGQERYKLLTPMYYRNARVALVCFDLANQEELFARAKFWIDQLALLGPADIAVKMVATKQDLADDAGADVLAFCRERELQLVYTSAKSGSGVVDLFDTLVAEASQDVFDSYRDNLSRIDDLEINLRVREGGCC